jgi:hypothetical protein
MQVNSLGTKDVSISHQLVLAQNFDILAINTLLKQIPNAHPYRQLLG